MPASRAAPRHRHGTLAPAVPVAERSVHPPTAPPRRAAAAYPCLQPSTAAPRDAAAARPRPSRGTSPFRTSEQQPPCLRPLLPSAVRLKPQKETPSRGRPFSSYFVIFCRHYGQLDPVHMQLDVDTAICSGNYIAFYIFILKFL